MNIPRKISRRKTISVQIGSLMVGSDFPIRVQTMANTHTDDIDGSVAQVRRCEEAGAELFRFTTQGMKEVQALGLIKESLHGGGVPLVADIHFRSDVADAAAAVADKVRINPGNYANQPELIRERFSHLLGICKEHHTALRIGVNHGSLSQRIKEKYGDTQEGMVESCMEFLRIAREEDFTNIVLSIKASNTRIMVETVRLLVRTMDAEGMAYPLHLGVTEAGEGEDGRIKSAVGIGALLAEGIGDTIRVSLSEDPEAEIPVARDLVDYFYRADSKRYTQSLLSKEGDEILFSLDMPNSSLFALYAAAECGRLLWEHNTQKLRLTNSFLTEGQLQQISMDILQASQMVRYKTEFVSCPGCGRTMFDLQQTVQTLKKAFLAHPFADEHHPKIAIMGCIVNGPGEMADADYGYVGAGRDRISLYRGKECVRKNIPQEEAVEALLELIRHDSLS